MFRLTTDVIREVPPEESAAGAYVVFEGRVRDTNEGRRVLAVEYEAHEELAIAEGESVLADACKRYHLQDARCVHRIGRLKVGDTAVWVCAAAGHRSEAFAACRYIIDEVKRRVPIWKKEHYKEGDSQWLHGEPLGTPLLTEQSYYSRQALLPELAAGGQDRLRDARILVVGAGGLGCAALPYLVAAGVGHVSVCDSDVLEATNLHRQVLYAAKDIGRSKAELAVERLRTLNPFVSLVAHTYRLTPENVSASVNEHDVVLDCTDNFETKFVLNDACVALGKPLVQASIYQMEGQIQVVVPGTGCLRCLWPVTPPRGCVGSCTEVGVLGVLPGFFGVLQATEAIKLITGIGDCLRSTLLLVDLRTYQLTRLERRRNPSCHVCGNGATTTGHTAVEVATADDLGSDAVPSWLVRADCPMLDSMTVIDLREVGEAREPVPLVDDRALNIPMSRFARALPELDPAKRYVLVCAHGSRASRLAQQLHARGLTNFLALDPRAYEVVTASPRHAVRRDSPNTT